MLIILAGVLINITLGNNGIMNKSKDAKKQHMIAQYQEEIEVTKAELASKNDGTVTPTTVYDENNSHTFTIKSSPANGDVNETTAKTFDGWYESNTLTGTKHTTTSNSTIVVTDSVTLYGTWRGITANDVRYTESWAGGENGTVATALNYLYNEIKDTNE